jgi:hypothetical protein
MKRSQTRFVAEKPRLLLALCMISSAVQAHGIVGNRYFPGTLTFDDPAVADELILPNFSYSRHPVAENDNVDDSTAAASFARLLTPDLAVGVDSSWTQWKRQALQRQDGFDTTSISLKGRFYENDPHEALISASLGWGVPDSGSTAVGAGAPGSIQPAILFGKGFGDVPDRFAWLRPFGIAGGVSALFPSRRYTDAVVLNPATGRLETVSATNPDLLHWGFALEYSMLYLTDRFDGGPPKEEPLNQMVPLVEFAFDSQFGDGLGHKTAGTVNPGLSYVAVSYQVAAEAIVPMNHEAGSGVGVRVQLLLFLDDLVPSIFDKPLFSDKPLFGR